MTADGPELTHFQHLLRSRSAAVRRRIHEALVRSDHEPYLQIAGQVHDAEEAALADLLVDVNLAEISHHVQELRDIDAALRRISLGSYGSCIRCHEPIAPERLEAYPTAKRCLRCQKYEEHTRLSTPAPSM